MVYTTNVVVALHRQFRRVPKTRGAFPTDDALKQMLYLATLDLKESYRSRQNDLSRFRHEKCIVCQQIGTY